jgi:Ala-tRNA(Pro) deacylase
MPSDRLVRYLEDNDADFQTLRHPRAITAQEIAAAAHVPGRELAKTVVVRLDDDYAVAVVPASDRVDLARLADVAGAHHAELAREDALVELFPGSELGAMPPFGNLYDLQVFVSDHLAEDESIAFNAGSLTELIRMRYADFARLAAPTVGDFSVRA